MAQGRRHATAGSGRLRHGLWRWRARQTRCTCGQGALAGNITNGCTGAFSQPHAAGNGSRPVSGHRWASSPSAPAPALCPLRRGASAPRDRRVAALCQRLRRSATMGTCGSKEQFKEQATKLAASAQAAAGSAWGDLSELTAAYNPLQAKGDANSRCDGAAGGLRCRRRTTMAPYLPPAGHSWPVEPRCTHVAALRSSTAMAAPVRLPWPPLGFCAAAIFRRPPPRCPPSAYALPAASISTQPPQTAPMHATASSRPGNSNLDRPPVLPVLQMLPDAEAGGGADRQSEEDAEGVEGKLMLRSSSFAAIAGGSQLQLRRPGRACSLLSTAVSAPLQRAGHNCCTHPLPVVAPPHAGVLS